MSLTGASKSRFPLLLVAGCALLAAIGVRYVPGREPSLRVTPVDVEAWRASLLDRAQTFGDGEAAALAGDSAQAMRAGVTSERLRTVEAARWDALFDELARTEGLWRKDAKAPWRDRVSPEDESHVTAIFFAPDEAPFDELRMRDAQLVYLQRSASDARLLEVRHVPAGVRDGEVTTSRFYKSRWTLPDRFAWPLRYLSLRLALIGSALLVAAWIHRLSSQAAPSVVSAGGPVRNPRRVSAWRSLAVAAAATAGAFVPGFVGLEGMSGGFAIITLCGFVALSAFVVAVVFFRSAQRLDRLLAGPDLFARWTYTPQEWVRFTEVELREEKSAKRDLFRWVAIIIAVVTGGFVLVARDEASLFVAAVMGVLTLVLWILSVRGPEWSRLRALRAGPEAWLGPEGAFVGGMFYDLGMAGSSLESVGLREAEGILVLEGVYSYVARYGRETVSFRVPVPGGDEAEGRRVAQRMAELLGQGDPRE